jgi:RND superfamily putative drug exporter
VDVAELGLLASSTAGITVVRSPVGAYGAPLSAWLGLASAPTPERTVLLATLGAYVGTDGRTVLLQLQTSAAGLSYNAVSAVRGVEDAFRTFGASHPEVAALAFGGGAPVIGDLADETELATEAMLIAVTVGLVLVLLVVLRSWIIALLGVASIGLSISWAWALTDLVLQRWAGVAVFFYVRTLLIMLVLGLGIDYNIFLLTRVREERIRGRHVADATVEAVGRTGGIISAAAVILASAFGALLVGEFTLISAIGFSVAVAVLLDAMVVRTYLVPASLQLLGERVWTLSGRRPSGRAAVGDDGPGDVPAVR